MQLVVLLLLHVAWQNWLVLQDGPKPIVVGQVTTVTEEKPGEFMIETRQETVIPAEGEEQVLSSKYYTRYIDSTGIPAQSLQQHDCPFSSLSNFETRQP